MRLFSAVAAISTGGPSASRTAAEEVTDTPSRRLSMFRARIATSLFAVLALAACDKDKSTTTTTTASNPTTTSVTGNANPKTDTPTTLAVDAGHAGATGTAMAGK